MFDVIAELKQDIQDYGTSFEVDAIFSLHDGKRIYTDYNLIYDHPIYDDVPLAPGLDTQRMLATQLLELLENQQKS